MRYAAAYVLATLAGNTNPDVATLSKILGSVGIDCDKTKAQKVIDACKGKNIDQIIAEGTKKLSSLPVGGGAVAATGSAGGAPAAAPTADAKKGGAKEEAKKEEKKKDDSDEEGDDMVCISIQIKRTDHDFAFIFRALVYLIKLNTKQNKSSFNIHQTTAHHHNSYLLRLFLFMCVCFVLICYLKKRKERKKNTT
jgi:large subunit ribosomal protein LP2